MKKVISSLSAAAGVLLLLAIVSIPAQAQRASEFRSDRQSRNYMGTNEFNLKVSYPSIFTLLIGGLSTTLNQKPSDDAVRTHHFILPTFGLEYGNNVTKWLSVGAGIYTGYVEEEWLEPSGVELHDVYVDISLMVNLRFYWLSMPMIRLYSGFGAGVYLVMNQTPQLAPSFDIRLFGMTVGRRFYGNFEFGTFGMGGTFLNGGIGFRF